MSIKSINLNGTILPKKRALFSIENRALKYGDGLFESIRILNGKMPFLSLHIKRLKKGMKTLKLKIPKKYSTAFFKKEISKLIYKKANLRIRLSVFRKPGGLYTPHSNQVIFCIQAQEFGTPTFQLNPEGLTLGIYTENYLACNSLSNIKTSNSLIYILASIFSKENKFDDALLANEYDRIAETSRANIFFVKNGKLYTPPLNEGCLKGTMRSIIVKLAKRNKINVIKQKIDFSFIYGADEAFTTNAISGINWIKKIDEKSFKQNKTSSALLLELNKLL